MTRGSQTYYRDKNCEILKIGERLTITYDDECETGIVIEVCVLERWHRVQWLTRLPEGTLCVFDETE